MANYFKGFGVDFLILIPIFIAINLFDAVLERLFHDEGLTPELVLALLIWDQWREGRKRGVDG